MLVIKIELWPGGDGTRARTLATGRIVNNATGDEGCGNYYVFLKDARNRPWKSGHVHNFPRKRLLAWDLLCRALVNLIGDRNAIQPVPNRQGTRGDGTPESPKRNRRRAGTAPDCAGVPEQIQHVDP